MRLAGHLLWLFFSVALALAQNTSPGPGRATHITHVTVIDTETGKESRDQTVVISRDRISEVEDSTKVKPAAGAKVVDGTGKYLIPGLWDMHVHTWDYESTYPLYVANGVTGVRDMFGPPDANKFRTELAEKAVIAPHFYLASPIVDGHPPVWPDSIEVTTPEQARNVVDDQQKKGADFIKVYSRLAPNAYFTIAAESARVGIPFEGHVPVQVTAWQASDAKQKSFEHLTGIAVACSTREQELQAKVLPTAPLKERDAIAAEAARSYSESKCIRLFEQLKKNGNWQVPTLTVLRSFGLVNDSQSVKDTRLRYFTKEYRHWLAPKDDFRFKGWTPADFALQTEQFQFSKKLVGAMFRSRVPLLAGTDTGNPYCFPGFSLHDELALLVESGVSPLGGLQMATRNPALFMDATDKYGSVTPGKVADLVLLDADPLQDIHNTTRISEVFLAGKEYDRAALNQILASAERAARDEQKRSSTQTTHEASQSSAQQSNLPQPPPEMQSLAKAFEGTWSIDEKFEPTEARPQGGVGHATEIWRRGPGGFTFMEEFRDDDPSREFGLALIWWDKTKGFQGIWCDKMDPRSCGISQPGSGRFQWDGKQQVVDYELKKDGKTFQGHEVLAKTSTTSFVQTLDIGEKGGPLKRWQTIHATRISTESKVSAELSARDTATASPEMQKLFRALQGAWSYQLQRASGQSVQGEEVWRVGPGGVTLIEDEHDKDESRELFGLSVTWWDAVDKGYRALWCDNTLPTGCKLMSKLAQWEGADFVLRDQFERDGKKIDYKEVVSDITPTTYTQTIYQGEAGGELKRVLTIHASKVADSTESSQEIDPAFRGFWTLNVEKSDFGDRPKPKTGFVNWGEHGWTFGIVMADARLYADSVETDHGCTLIGVFPGFSCEIEVVTPRHVRITIKQGDLVRNIGDIELLNDGTTQTTHHMTPASGAPYVQKTIWEKQVRK